MQHYKQQHLSFLFLLLFAVPLFFINIHNGHSWGDDFSQYVKEAQNIATGKPYYQSNYIFNRYNAIYAPPQYPPGFPLLLAPVIKFWGLSFRAMCYFNSLLATCLLFALFAYFRKRDVGAFTSVCLAVMATYSHYVLDMKGYMLADVPCLLFITLYLVYRKSAYYSWKRILLLIILAVIAIQVRTQGIFLLVAEAIFLFFSLAKTLIKKQRHSVRDIFLAPSLLIISGVFVLNFFINKVVFYTPLSTTSFYNDFIRTMLSGGLVQMLRDYLIYLFKVMQGFFYQETIPGIFNATGFLIGCTGIILSIIGFLVSISRRLSFDDIFFVIMCGLIICYPVRDPRYFLPALPLLFYYSYVAFRVILPAILRFDYRVAAILLTALYLRSEYSYIKTLNNPVPASFMPAEKDKTAFKYIREHINDRDIIAFAKPRALLYLLTSEPSMSPGRGQVWIKNNSTASG